MKILINLVLVALIVFLCYGLYSSINEPIKFEAEKNKREQTVIDRLRDIKSAQEIYREVTGEFAGDFDSLKLVLMNDSIEFVNLIGDPDDPENMDKVQRIYSYSPAIDTINALGINLDSIPFVPYAPKGTKFDIKADTITYQSSLVHVVQVGTRYNVFMGKFASPEYAKYDSQYDPDRFIKFGDLGKPTLTGNWE